MEDKIKEANWKKTNYVAPHEYVICEKYPRLFNLLKEKIKKEGYDKEFRYLKHRKMVRYYDYKGYTYWITGVCLNRKLKIQKNKLTGGNNMPIKKLEELYKKYWDGLRLFRNNNGLSSPLLIKTKNKKIKLFIVGQETFGGWTGNSIKECQNDYKEVLTLCLKTEKPKKRYQKEWDTWSTYQSVFWRTVRTLTAKLKINQEKECVAWNNINRMDQKGHGPNNKIKNQMIKKFPLLPQEIKICKPEIIVFFTHQRYDELLKQVFEESRTKISFQKIQGLPQKKLAKITIAGFKGKAYRTYHPAYKPKKEIEKIISTIIKDLKNKKENK